MENFRKFGLSEQFLKLLVKAGFDKFSEIQEKVIPLVLAGKDVIGSSATGSGKTLAFGAGIIEKIESDDGAKILILTPTRELAEQVGNVFIKFSSYRNLSVAIVYGGVQINSQIRQLKTSNIIIGTPGRILDHLERGTLDLSKIKTLVLDEADRMLDMGFVKDVEKIIRNCPKERQTLLFSATISPEIERIAERYMKNPEIISVDNYVDPKKLKQIYYDVPGNMKFSLLVHLLKREDHGLVMVFCNTRHNTDFIANNLRNFGIDVMAIHGGFTQQKRNRTMESFNEKKVYVLVCTDIASRGLDIKGISHVYNYDLPNNSNDYVHRIGRTARAGKDGIAINIISERDYENFRNIQDNESFEIKKEELPQMEMVRTMKIEKSFSKKEKWSSDNWRDRNKKRGDSRSGRDESHPRKYRSGSRPVRRVPQKSSNYRFGKINRFKGKRSSGRKKFSFGGRKKF